MFESKIYSLSKPGVISIVGILPRFSVSTVNCEIEGSSSPIFNSTLELGLTSCILFLSSSWARFVTWKLLMRSLPSDTAIIYSWHQVELQYQIYILARILVYSTLIYILRCGWDATIFIFELDFEPSFIRPCLFYSYSSHGVFETWDIMYHVTSKLNFEPTIISGRALGSFTS